MTTISLALASTLTSSIITQAIEDEFGGKIVGKLPIVRNVGTRTCTSLGAPLG